jgi:hypothetical protein
MHGKGSWLEVGRELDREEFQAAMLSHRAAKVVRLASASCQGFVMTKRPLSSLDDEFKTKEFVFVRG